MIACFVLPCYLLCSKFHFNIFENRKANDFCHRIKVIFILDLNTGWLDVLLSVNFIIVIPIFIL